MTIDIIKSSTTFSEAIKKIYGYDNGKTRKKFTSFVNQNNIDISHLQKKHSKFKEVVKNCPVCGIEFKTVTDNKNEKTTCSYSCSNTFFRSGKNNPNWKDEKYQTTCWLYHKKNVWCVKNRLLLRSTTMTKITIITHQKIWFRCAQLITIMFTVNTNIW